MFSFDWNYDGSLIALTTKDKKVRVFDPRSRSVVQVLLSCAYVCAAVSVCVRVRAAGDTDGRLCHVTFGRRARTTRA